MFPWKKWGGDSSLFGDLVGVGEDQHGAEHGGVLRLVIRLLPHRANGDPDLSVKRVG